MHVVPSQVASGEQPKVQGSPGPGKALHTGFSKSVVSQKPEAQPMNPGQGEPLGIGAPQTEPSQAKPAAQPKPEQGSPAPGSFEQVPGAVTGSEAQNVPAAQDTNDVSDN